MDAEDALFAVGAIGAEAAASDAWVDMVGLG